MDHSAPVLQHTVERTAAKVTLLEELVIIHCMVEHLPPVERPARDGEMPTRFRPQRARLMRYFSPLARRWQAAERVQQRMIHNSQSKTVHDIAAAAFETPAVVR